MIQTQQELERLKTLQESYNDLSGGMNTLLSRSVKYDKQSGNLTIENVELTIE